MVPAVVGAYQCNGTVDWLEEEHPYYPPTVNDPGAAEFAKGVVGKLLGKGNVSGSTVLRSTECSTAS
jgi:IAA-amino acid hydrolase